MVQRLPTGLNGSHGDLKQWTFSRPQVVLRCQGHCLAPPFGGGQPRQPWVPATAWEDTEDDKQVQFLRSTWWLVFDMFFVCGVTMVKHFQEVLNAMIDFGEPS